MSQRTPIAATPPRRQNDRGQITPTSMRAGAALTPSTSTPGLDRATLQDRLDTIELQIRDLKTEIATERQRRTRSSQRRREKERATLLSSGDGTTYSPLALLDTSGHSPVQMKAMLVDRLKSLDDDALTALLTVSTAGLAALIAGQDQIQAVSASYLTIDAGLVPSKSVGIEGVGSGSDIDRRLLLASKTDSKDRWRQAEESKDIASSLKRARHSKSVHEWLIDRQKRSNALIDGLVQFTQLEIESIKQTDARIAARAGSAAGSEQRRNVQIKGTFARLFPVEIRCDVVENSREASRAPSSSSTSVSSPEIQNLRVTLPQWLETTLNEHHNHLNKLIRRNDLPAILLTLRTMIPLISLRRNLFTTLMVKYTDLARSHVRAWETKNKVQFQPWHPSIARKRSATSIEKRTDETHARALIVSQQADTLSLKNTKGVTLDIAFQIRWSRYGHASPFISLTPHVPSHLVNASAKAFLATFTDEAQHLLDVSIRQMAEITLPDLDEEEDFDPTVGRFGILPAINAVIQGFFGLRPSRPQAPNVDDNDDSS